MNHGNIIAQYYAGMTTILKFFILYILSKWYSILFGFPFLYLYFRIYKIIINKKYNLFSLSLKDQYLILKSIFSGKININEINLDKNSKKEDIIKIIKEFINNNYIFKRILVYKWNNYYWRQLNEKEIEKNINIDNNIDNELNKKFNLLIFLYFFNSGNLILRPCVFILVPEGKGNLDNLESIKDLPLFEFPITPILITLSSVNSLYLFSSILGLKSTFHPLIISFIEFI